MSPKPPYVIRTSFPLRIKQIASYEKMPSQNLRSPGSTRENSLLRMKVKPLYFAVRKVSILSFISNIRCLARQLFPSWPTSITNVGPYNAGSILPFSFRNLFIFIFSQIGSETSLPPPVSASYLYFVHHSFRFPVTLFFVLLICKRRKKIVFVARLCHSSFSCVALINSPCCNALRIIHLLIFFRHLQQPLRTRPPV